MNEKEKKAIKSMKRFVECRQDMATVTASEMKTVLNLLEKKDRTIQQLKDKNRTLNRQAQQYFEQGIKKDKIINEYEKECRQFKAFCKKVRRDEKHDVDLFNQGQEHKCNQFLNLISRESHWNYEGKYFDDTDNQIKQYFENKAEEEK